MTEQEKVAKIVELRRQGMKWGQVEAIIFPGSDPKKGAPKCGPLAKKAGAAGEGAFEKIVWGAFTPTQVVMPIRRFPKPDEITDALAEVLAMS